LKIRRPDGTGSQRPKCHLRDWAKKYHPSGIGHRHLDKAAAEKIAET
jgi:hypothetical protein